MRTQNDTIQGEFFENLRLASDFKKRYKRKRYKPYKLYVPQNLDLDNILRDYPPNFKGLPKNYSNYRSKFLYILHLINSIPNSKSNFDFDEHFGFIPVNKEYLQSRIHEYKLYIDYLITHGIITEGTSYIPLKRSRGLQFSPKYRTPVKSVTITCNSLIKSIVTKNKNRNLEREEKLSFLFEWFNKLLTINDDQAIKFIHDNHNEAFKKVIAKREKKKYSLKYKLLLPSVSEVVRLGNISKLLTITQIKEANYNFILKIDSTTGRLHSPLTRLKKELRKFLKYNDKTLVSIDITNSQPLMSLIILDFDIFMRLNVKDLISKYNPSYKDKVLVDQDNIKHISPSPSYTMLVNLINKLKNKGDIIEYKRAIVNGNFYERFGEILLEKKLIPFEILSIENLEKRSQQIRKFAKIATFQSLFDTTRAHYYNNVVKAFKACFPHVYMIFQQVKSGHRKVLQNGKTIRESAYNTLACILQRFESYLVLEKICVEINEMDPNIPIFTIHDSVVTITDHKDKVKQIFCKNVTELLGVNPCLEIEEWY